MCESRSPATAPGGCQHRGLGESLTNKAKAAGAERHPYRAVEIVSRRAHQQQRGHVDARDAEHQPGTDEQREQQPPVVAEHGVDERLDGYLHRADLRGKAVHHAAVHDRQLRPSAVGADTGAQAPDQLELRKRAVACVEPAGAAVEHCEGRRPDVGANRIINAFRGHADDAERSVAVPRQAATDERRIAAGSTHPEPRADDRRRLVSDPVVSGLEPSAESRPTAIQALEKGAGHRRETGPQHRAIDLDRGGSGRRKIDRHQRLEGIGGAPPFFVLRQRQRAGEPAVARRHASRHGPRDPDPGRSARAPPRPPPRRGWSRCSPAASVRTVIAKSPGSRRAARSA